MMYLYLISFFASLIAIIFMIGRKMSKLEHEQILNHKEIIFDVPYLKEIRHITAKNIRKLAHDGLVSTLRLYLRTMNFLKYRYEEMKIKIKNGSRMNQQAGNKKQISKFLKVIGDYKRKIREIKHRIKKEEDL